MPRRDPLADPMPGDVFRNKGGATYTIIDRFISLGKKGAAMPGYFIRSESPTGEVKYTTTAMVILRFRKKTWTVVKASEAKAIAWDDVDHYPHATVDSMMRQKHGLPRR